MLSDVIADLRDRIMPKGFHPRLAGSKVVDTGEMAERSIGLARRLNAVRRRSPKHPVVLWGGDYEAVTAPGRWVYVNRAFAARLSDDALAFVLAHEMAHHDLDHMTVHMGLAGALGWRVEMEYAADAHALTLVKKAGFDPRGALEALDPSTVPPEPPEERFADWPPRLRKWALRFVTSHPPHDARLAAIERQLKS